MDQKQQTFRSTVINVKRRKTNLLKIRRHFKQKSLLVLIAHLWVYINGCYSSPFRPHFIFNISLPLQHFSILKITNIYILTLKLLKSVMKVSKILQYH